MDVIGFETFEYSALFSSGNRRVGIFDWGFLYKEMTIPRREADMHTSRTESYRFSGKGLYGRKLPCNFH